PRCGPRSPAAGTSRYRNLSREGKAYKSIILCRWREACISAKTEVDLEAHRYSIDRVRRCRIGRGRVQLHEAGEGTGYRAAAGDNRGTQDHSAIAYRRACRGRRRHRAGCGWLQDTDVTASAEVGQLVSW